MKTPIGATMYNFVSIGRPIYIYSYIRYEFVYNLRLFSLTG